MTHAIPPLGDRDEIHLLLEHARSRPERWERLKVLDVPLTEAPERVYRVPDFMKKTAPEPLYREFEELLDELRTLNRSHLGESLLEAFLVAGLDEWSTFLRRAFLSWGEAYLAVRAAKPHPRDRSARDRFLRLGKEVYGLLEPLLACSTTLHVAILNPVRERLLFRVYNTTLEPYIHPERMLLCPKDAPPEQRLAPEYFPVDPIPGWKADEVKRWKLFDSVMHTAWLIDTIRISLELLRLAHPEPAQPRPPRAETERRLQRAAEDLQAVRPFLPQHVIGPYLRLAAPESMSVKWRWSLSGLGTIRLGPAEGHSLPLDPLSPGTVEYTVDCEGLPVEYPDETRSFDHLPAEEQDELLYLHLLTLEDVLQRLCQLWDTLETLAGLYATVEKLEKLDAEARLGTVTSQVAEAGGEEASALLGARARPLRFNRLRSVLEKLGVEVRSGKGSEIVLCRGTNLFTLGHHTRNPVISPYLVGSLLRKLGISLEDFARHGGAG